jgi:hypothetical protein
VTIEALWATLQGPTTLLVLVVLLIGGLILRALSRVRRLLEEMADTLESCQHALEDLNREPRRRGRLERDAEPAEPADRLARRFGGGRADPPP